MPKDKENGRKRRYSDVLEDLYRGPQDFMEAGTRGFLVTSIPDREEHSIDETVKVLRKTCVKLYGGIKPLKREDASFAKGYVMIDFMDPEQVVPLPHPDAEKVAEEEKAKAADEEEAKEAVKEGEKMEEESKPEEETKQENVEASEEKPKAEGEGEAEAEGEAGAEKTEEEKESKAKEEKEKEEKKKKEDTRKRRDDEKKPLMLAPHKFKGFRTELRNMMFIKSDIPDPVEVATACFDLMLNRKPLYTDCVNQLLPVQGVCENDYKQLEIMCRRVLVPYVGEHLEEPPSFGVMLVNKMCEPGAEVLLEVVRSAVWCLNPCAWQCSPWAEPDVVIHIELIGSKIILCAMPHYMKYRQYSPFALYELGPGKPEDEERLVKDRSDDHHHRERGSRGGRRKEKNRQGEKKAAEPEKDQEEKKEDGEKEKDKEATAEVEAEAEATTEGNDAEQAEGEKEEEQPTTETEPEEKKEVTEKKSPRTRGGQKSKS